MGSIVSVNIGTPRTVAFRGREITTSIYKNPIEGRVRVFGVNIDGDDQADRTVHGGTDKAVYAYAEEDYEWWSDQLEHDIGPGHFGDNITTRGIDVGGAVIWRIGDVLLEVSEPRVPCYKLGIRMDDAAFPARFTQAERPGAYLRIIDEGYIEAGDQIETGPPPTHGVTVADVARIHSHDHPNAHRLQTVDELSQAWKQWAETVTGRQA